MSERMSAECASECNECPNEIAWLFEWMQMRGCQKTGRCKKSVKKECWKWVKHPCKRKKVMSTLINMQAKSNEHQHKQQSDQWWAPELLHRGSWPWDEDVGSLGRWRYADPYVNVMLYSMSDREFFELMRRCFTWFLNLWWDDSCSLILWWDDLHHSAELTRWGESGERWREILRFDGER